jgi:hypothetical protein
VRRSENGQVLLISVSIVLLLLLCVPILILVNMTGSRHQANVEKQTQAAAIAREGIAYASNRLANNQAAWNLALTGNFAGALPDCNIAGSIVAGTQFSLTCGCASLFPACTSGPSFPGLQPYQIAIKATAWLPGTDGVLAPVKSMQSFLSQKTLGASLSTGLRASAALQMVRAPNYANGTLTVHWGPIVCLDNALWTLNNPLDVNPALAGTPGYPRIFSNGGIKGTSFLRSPDLTTSLTTSDQKQYWAFASLAFPPLVNDSAYILNAAKVITGFPIPDVTLSGDGCPATSTDNGAGIFNVPGCTAIFNNTFTAPSVPNNAVIYVHGNAEFDDLKLDLKNGGFIVDGNLTLNANDGTGGLNLVDISIPMTAPQEYPYWPITAPAKWPCQKIYYDDVKQLPPISPTCTSGDPGASPVNYRGFLWVKGNLIVNPSAVPWVLDGVVLIGDLTTPSGQAAQLTAGGLGSNLFIFFDAGINQNVLVNPG